MDEEDGVILIVVDDEDNQGEEELIADVDIKTEPIFSTEDEEFHQLQELFNQSIVGASIKTEPEDLSDGDFLANEEYEAVQSSDEQSIDSEHGKKKLNRHWRIPDPSKWRSVVSKLRKQVPNSKKNEKALVAAILTEMHKVQAPSAEGMYQELGNKGGYMCIICFTEKPSKGEIERHYLCLHGPRYCVCLACGADFRSTTNLYKHEKRCQAPDAGLVLKARRLYIIKRTRGERKYDVDGQLVRRFKCELCPAAYVAKISLVSHMRMHNAERPFKCRYCPRAYTSNSVLAKHMWTHCDKSYVCDHCGKGFKHKTALASHIFTHYAPRFPCQECTKRFTYKSALLLHVHQKHRNLPPPCACQMCPRRFGRMWALKEHMQKVHGMILMTRRMFFKQLPFMSQTEIQRAKVVLKSEVPVLHPSDLNLDLDVKDNDLYTNSVELDSESGFLVKTEPNDMGYEEILKSEDNMKVECSTSEVINEGLKIVVTDDNEVDYVYIGDQYRTGDYKNSRNIVVVENGEIKPCTEEEILDIERQIAQIECLQYENVENVVAEDILP